MPTLQEAVALAPALGPWIGGAGVAAVLLRAWQPFRKMSLDRDGTLVATLIARVEKLEADLATVTRNFEVKIEHERASYSALMAMMRHRLNNVQACLDALLMLLKHDPTRAAEAVQRIEEMRNRHAKIEAQERAEIEAARIVAAGAGQALKD